MARMVVSKGSFVKSAANLVLCQRQFRLAGLDCGARAIAIRPTSKRALRKVFTSDLKLNSSMFVSRQNCSILCICAIMVP
jgi:hypothetical protein